MWKGKPIGDGTPFEAERALMPCEFNSRSFRLVLANVPLAERQRYWTSNRRGRFNSDMALCLE